VYFERGGKIVVEGDHLASSRSETASSRERKKKVVPWEIVRAGEDATISQKKEKKMKEKLFTNQHAGRIAVKSIEKRNVRTCVIKKTRKKAARLRERENPQGLLIHRQKERLADFTKKKRASTVRPREHFQNTGRKRREGGNAEGESSQLLDKAPPEREADRCERKEGRKKAGGKALSWCENTGRHTAAVHKKRWQFKGKKKTRFT